MAFIPYALYLEIVAARVGRGDPIRWVAGGRTLDALGREAAGVRATERCELVGFRHVRGRKTVATQQSLRSLRRGESWGTIAYEAARVCWVYDAGRVRLRGRCGKACLEGEVTRASRAADGGVDFVVETALRSADGGASLEHWARAAGRDEVFRRTWYPDGTYDAFCMEARGPAA